MLDLSEEDLFATYHTPRLADDGIEARNIRSDRGNQWNHAKLRDLWTDTEKGVEVLYEETIMLQNMNPSEATQGGIWTYA